MTALPALGSIVAGKYRVVSLLGEGGMGAVFRAHHELMDMPVALKCLHPELSSRADAKERFVREARAAGRIRHPHVVEVYDVGEHENALFMVMELLEGESFAELIREQRLPVRQALSILIDAMEGVAAAHARGIVHRDIKPENIFVVRTAGGKAAGEAPLVKILDFGVSKLLDNAGGTGSVTMMGQAVGTPEYMAPEQMLGEPDVDQRADVYSFGVLLYRVLTGEAPFRGDNFAAIAVQVATHKPISPRELRPEIPAMLDRIVMRAMARDRDERHPSLRVLIDALRPIATGDALSMLVPLATHVAARGSSIARDMVSRSGRHVARNVWIPLVLGLLLAVWVRWQRSDDSPAASAQPAVPALPQAEPEAGGSSRPPSLSAQAPHPQGAGSPSPGPSALAADPEPVAIVADPEPEPVAIVPDPEPEPVAIVPDPEPARPREPAARPRKATSVAGDTPRAHAVRNEPPAAAPAVDTPAAPPTAKGLRSGALSRGDF